ncbi:unnamed protein product [Amoebophrya sp. A120]|nr:unnamed protein product [Amoebophrya sp. A120]|eukprot:GSA120T00010641001.1
MERFGLGNKDKETEGQNQATTHADDLADVAAPSLDIAARTSRNKADVVFTYLSTLLLGPTGKQEQEDSSFPADELAGNNSVTSAYAEIFWKELDSACSLQEIAAARDLKKCGLEDYVIAAVLTRLANMRPGNADLRPPRSDAEDSFKIDEQSFQIVWYFVSQCVKEFDNKEKNVSEYEEAKDIVRRLVGLLVSRRITTNTLRGKTCLGLSLFRGQTSPTALHPDLVELTGYLCQLLDLPEGFTFTHVEIAVNEPTTFREWLVAPSERSPPGRAAPSLPERQERGEEVLVALHGSGFRNAFRLLNGMEVMDGNAESPDAWCNVEEVGYLHHHKPRGAKITPGWFEEYDEFGQVALKTEPQTTLMPPTSLDIMLRLFSNPVQSDLIESGVTGTPDYAGKAENTKKMRDAATYLDGKKWQLPTETLSLLECSAVIQELRPLPDSSLLEGRKEKLLSAVWNLEHLVEGNTGLFPFAQAVAVVEEDHDVAPRVPAPNQQASTASSESALPLFSASVSSPSSDQQFRCDALPLPELPLSLRHEDEEGDDTPFLRPAGVSSPSSDQQFRYDNLPLPEFSFSPRHEDEEGDYTPFLTPTAREGLTNAGSTPFAHKARKTPGATPPLFPFFRAAGETPGATPPLPGSTPPLFPFARAAGETPGATPRFGDSVFTPSGSLSGCSDEADSGRDSKFNLATSVIAQDTKILPSVVSGDEWSSEQQNRSNSSLLGSWDHSSLPLRDSDAQTKKQDTCGHVERQQVGVLPPPPSNLARPRLAWPDWRQFMLGTEENLREEEAPTPEPETREFVKEEIVEEEIIEEDFYGAWEEDLYKEYSAPGPAFSLRLPPLRNHSNSLLPHETANPPSDVASVNGTYRPPSMITGTRANHYHSGSTARGAASGSSFQKWGPSFKEEVIEEEVVEEEVVRDQADNHWHHRSAAPRHWTSLKNDNQSWYQSHWWSNSKPSWSPKYAQMADGKNIWNTKSMLPGAFDDNGSLYGGGAGTSGKKDAQDVWHYSKSNAWYNGESIAPASEHYRGAKDWSSKCEKSNKKTKKKVLSQKKSKKGGALPKKKRKKNKKNR